jgi:AcrR family transcriptional regulator
VATRLESRPLRADARRNHDAILSAAAAAFSERGPDLPLEEIARRAEVSPATLFRHFASRDDLVAAVIEHRFAAEVEPTIDAALVGDDPWVGLVEVIAATVRIGTTSPAWRATMTMAKDAGLVSETTRERFHRSLGELLERAKASGEVRATITVADLTPIIAMLRALVMGGTDAADDWRRYLSLLLRDDTTT